jgi:enoyl-CoA hydratase/carnithine racemase
MNEPVRVERREADGNTYAVVTIDRPESRNALTRRVLVLARDAMIALAADDGVRTIVLTGAGDSARAAFCSGADLRASFADDPDLPNKLDEYLDDFHGLIKSIWNAPKPVVARVDGCAVGFGCDLALACDLRVLSDRAYFQESFTKIGLMPDGGGTGVLPRMVGMGVAKELIFLASKIDSERALRLGLATRVVPAASLDEATYLLASQLAAGPPMALRESKQALHAAMGISIEEVLRREREGQLKCLRSSDAMEGIAAWTQKRAPKFTGA